jgi:hypothetical protein
VLRGEDFTAPHTRGKMRLNRSAQVAVYFLCVLMLASTPWARSQEQTNPVPRPGVKPAKEQPEEQEPEAKTTSGTEALQKATQNPVASLISVPVQNNTNFGVNPGYRTQDVLNIQPVIPIGISKDWNLIVRWIAPIVYQPLPNQPSTPETGVYGLGGMVPSFFISPRRKTGTGLFGLPAFARTRDAVPAGN